MNKFWKNKKVLITGHTGFKGAWLTLILSKMGSEVHGVSLKEKKKSFFNTLDINKCLRTNNYQNINDYIKLKKLILRIKPDFIFHLAAQPLVIESYNNPLETLMTNIIGTANLLKSIRNLKNNLTVIIVTSDKCYLPNKQKLLKENDHLGGNDIYSASKACAEIISNAYRETFYKAKKIKIATVRAGNVVGGGDFSKNRIIPDLMKAYVSKKSCIIRNKNSTRPWQHVLDPINGYLILAKKIYETKNKLYQSGWNFGPSTKSYKVAELIQEVKKIISIKIKIKTSKNKITETKNLRLSNSKTKKYLNWKPKIDFKDLVKMTLEWYMNQSNKNKIIKITNKQIDNFFKIKND